MDISRTLIDYVTLFRCPQCRVYQIEGDDQIFESDGDILAKMTLRARKCGLFDVDKEAAEIPWEDPRWEMIQYE